MSSIREVFEESTKHLSIDAKFVKKIVAYQTNFTYKNQDHIEFYGGHLTGVQIVRFTDQDRYRWFDEILDLDDSELEEKLLALPTVNKDFHVSSDTFNLSCAYLIHAIYRSKLLKPEQKHEGMLNVALVMQHRFITSRLFLYFKYPADRAIAEAAYAQMSGKYAIKQYGNWFDVLKARSEDMIGPNSIHKKTIEDFEPDTAIIYLLNDTQGRIRDMLKNIYSIHKLTAQQGLRIQTSSSLVTFDGEEILRDKSRNLQAYIRYINSIISDKPSFIRQELLEIIEKLMHTMSPRFFKQTLEWMSDHYREGGNDSIESLLNETLIHSFDYLNDNRNLVKNGNDLPGLLARLRGIYTSSRSTDPILFDLREKAEAIVILATKNKNTSMIAAVRTGILLYIIARAYSMRYYSQSLTAV